MVVTLDPSSRARLTPRTKPRFVTGSLFDTLARTVCDADCLPRKEFYEAWEVARRARRRMRGGRVVELAAGHGLLAMILLILDDTSPTALCVDRKKPQSFERLLPKITAAWPRLTGRITFIEGDLHNTIVGTDDLVVSVHACGRLSDAVIDCAVAARSRLVLMPCCHDLRSCNTGGLDTWMPGPLAIDAMRAARLRQLGYETIAVTIPADITPMNRLLLASPCVANPGAGNPGH
ncbi:MAG: methyltransferase domain-containing protein [Deltaproteobacteria bacterium RIFOXYA12_FULL_58_15]|nr:MAG: methyltransferase domain-containing protein [Deltaproteobacteria bacterium RIFOXYA12_FULL_58_15]OGR11502.1 MAG: methyltransferase domain-containing protein [Deltaproteobacteria bacterium RIFOXYB12_FULL_58_9]